MPKIVDHDGQRQIMIDAMWRVVARDGAAAVSVRTVAAEAGLSKTGMSHYFESQGQLLALAIEQSVATVTERIMELDVLNLGIADAAEALSAMIPTTPKRRRQGQVWLLLLAQENDPSVSRVLHALNMEVRSAIVDILSSLKARGIIECNVEIEAAALHAIIDGLSIMELTDRKLSKLSRVNVVVQAQLERLAIVSKSRV